MSKISEKRIINSALWAAYGDALGFMTELADKKMLKTRTGQDHVSTLCMWKRKIGGLYGPIVDMPAGAYSDDTQLRLASSRSINVDGHFAIQSFSKIEIPVWQSYALGAGRGSKVAASALTKKNTVWFSNFYSDKKTKYINAGGNGGVMRIQPHVWSAKTLNEPANFLLDVIKNTLVTHGHPRAVAGSVIHALTLAHSMSNETIASCEMLHAFNEWTLEIPNILKKDLNLSTSWVPQYEAESSKGLEEAYQDVHEEIESLINIVTKWSNDKGDYASLIERLDLTNESVRGSGTLTAIAASAAATLLDRMSLDSLITEVINSLGTDTDSIATMIGAICGLVTEEQPPSPVQDADYITLDAKRLYSISQNQVKGELNHNYQYPNPLSWRSPSSSLDYIVSSSQGLYFEHFGIVHEVSSPYSSNNTEKYNYVYQWVKSTIGQTFLVKKRNQSSIKEHEPVDTMNHTDQFMTSNNSQLELTEEELPVTNTPADPIDLNHLTGLAINNRFDPQIIGQHILLIADSELGINGVVAYSAIVAKARVARKEKSSN